MQINVFNSININIDVKKKVWLCFHLGLYDYIYNSVVASAILRFISFLCPIKTIHRQGYNTIIYPGLLSERGIIYKIVNFFI